MALRIGGLGRTGEDGLAHVERVSWGAIIAGAVCALALQIVFTLLTAGLGLSMIEDGDPSGAGVGTGIFFAVTVVLSLFAGGAVAGRLSGEPMVPSATLHGIVVWALVMLGVAWMGVSATGALVRGATQTVQSAAGAVGGVASGAGGAIGDLASALAPDMDTMGDVDLQSLLPPSIEEDLAEITGDQNLSPQQLQAEAQSLAASIVDDDDVAEARRIAVDAGRRMLANPGEAEETLEAAVQEMTAPEGPLGDQQFEELQAELSQRYGIDEARSEEIAQRWREEFVAARDELVETFRTAYTGAAEQLNDAADAAAETAEAAAEAAASAAWWAAFGSFLGLLAASIGAAVSRPEDIVRDDAVAVTRPGAPV